MYGQRKVPLKTLKEMLDKGMLQKDIAEELGFTKETVCRAVKKLNRLLPLYQLSEKERVFVKELAAGANQTEAAARAFDCSSRDSAKVIGCQLANRPDVKEGMGAWLEFKGMGREQRAEKLVKHFNDIDPSISLKALELGMKASRDFPDSKDAGEKPHVVYVVSFMPMGTPPEQEKVIEITPDKDALNLMLPEPESFYDRAEREQRHCELKEVINRLPGSEGEGEN